jgi:ABC-2 type transport system permease protein
MAFPTGAVLRHEVRGLLADRVVTGVALVLLLLTTYAVGVGHRASEGQREQVAMALAEEEERIQALQETMRQVAEGTLTPSPFQDPTRPWIAGRTRGQRHAVLPVASFQLSAVGQSDLVPAVVPVTLDGADPRGAREEIENPVHLLTGPLDLAFLATFLLPLLALLLSFDLLSREREDGTLALLLSQPVSARRLTLTRAGARWGILVTMVMGSTLAGLLFHTGGVPWGPFGAWMALVAAYLAFWVLLAVVVQATGGGSARSAVALAFAWLLLVVVVPAGVQITAELRHPVPSRAELVALERDAMQQVQGEAAEVLARYYDDHPELLPEGSVDAVDFQTRAFAVSREVQDRLAPVRRGLREPLEAQQGWTRSWQWVSPALVLHHTLLELAGTGDPRLAAFEGAVEAYHGAWVSYFEPFLRANGRLTPGELEAAPRWDHAAVAEKAPRTAMLPGLLGLLLFAGGVLAIAVGLLRDGGSRRWAP